MPLHSAAYRQAFARVKKLVLPIFRSDQSYIAFGLLALLVTFALSITALSGYNAVVAGNFMEAIKQKDTAGFPRLAILYLAMFGLCTVVQVFYSFTEQRFGLYWRNWLTGHLLDKYLANDAYYRMLGDTEIDNPDQRITEDVRTFTSTTLSLFLVLLNSTVQLVTFAGILWSITPWLMAAAVGYSLLGTVLSIIIGRPLVGLNVAQLRKEANLRYELIRVRENAEAIALMRNEFRERDRLGTHLGALIDNFRAIIGVNRNLGFFTISYNYLMPVIPALVVAPLYFRGEVDFGKITTAVVSFPFVQNALSVIVTQFGVISSYAAVVARVGAVWEATEAEPLTPAIEVDDSGWSVSFDGLSLETPKDHRTLIKNLNLNVPQGTRLLITGANGTGKSALFAAAAGLWRTGTGRIVRPPIGEVMFLPQKPYMMLGTLREQILCGNSTCAVVSTDRLCEVVRAVRLEHVLNRVGGLDIERDWANSLSVGEQRAIALARLLVANPRYAFLDVPVNATDPEQRQYFTDMLTRTAITLIVVSDDRSLRDECDVVLELGEEGKWAIKEGGNVKPG